MPQVSSKKKVWTGIICLLFAIVVWTFLHDEVSATTTNPVSESEAVKQQVAEQNGANPGDLIVLAAVSVYEPKIVSQEGNKLNISFDLYNEVANQPGVRYSVTVYKKTPFTEERINEYLDRMKVEGYTLDEKSKADFIANAHENEKVYQKIYDEILSIGEKETVSKNIVFVAPTWLNSGEYEIWVESANSQGLTLGHMSAGSATFVNDNTDLYLNDKDCWLSISTEEKGDKAPKYNLTEGIDISPTEDLTLHCKIGNGTDQEINAEGYVRIYRRNLYGKLVKEKKLEEKIVIDKTGFTAKLPKTGIAQAYDMVFVLNKDGKQISNELIIHYVEQGDSATFDNLTLDKDYYRAGEKAKVFITWTGTADFFAGSRSMDSNGGNPENDTAFKGLSLDLDIKDEQGQVCAKPFSYQMPKDRITDNLEITIDKDCLNPTITSTVKNNDGKIMDQSEMKVRTIKAPIKAETMSVDEDFLSKKHIISILLLGLLTILTLFVIWQKNKGDLNE